MEDDVKSPSTVPTKKQKIVDLNELANQAWVHYRNYLDSCPDDENDGDDCGGGSGGGEGDIDELQELLDLTTPHVSKLSLHSNPLLEWTSLSAGNKATAATSVSSLLPVLISVAYYHLANSVISEYIHLQQQQQQQSSSGIINSNTVLNTTTANETAEKAQNLLNQSLSYYPRNAGTWSMGANFGRMSRRLSLSSVRQWYERAITDATALKDTAIEVLEQSDDDIAPGIVKEWIELLYLHQILGIELVGGDDDEEEGGGKAMEEDEKDDENVPMEVSKSDYGDQANNADDDDADDTYYSYSTVEATSRFMCAMLWSTAGRHDVALSHLQHFPSLTHRLHPNVWKEGAGAGGTSNSSLGYNDVNRSTVTTATSGSPVAFHPPNGIIPTTLYQRLCQVFAPNAPYWKESDYANRGYYSYFIDYNSSVKQRATNLIEDVIINYLLPRAKQVLTDQRNRRVGGAAKTEGGDMGEDRTKDEDDDEASATQICGFEWWVHTRPIQANLGHNLHFDTDEALLSQEGKITHPIKSSVLYLTGGGEANSTTPATPNPNSTEPAGATIILDQTPDSDQVASTCWKSTPRDNCFMIFPGNMLHGVLPCPGPQETSLSDQDALGLNNDDNDNQSPETSIKHVQELMHRWKITPNAVKGAGLKEDSSAKPAGATTTVETSKHRLTFMVGFWTRNVPAGIKERRLYGPCGPLPPATDEHTWVREIQKGYKDTDSGENARFAVDVAAAKDSMPMIYLKQVSPAWEALRPKTENAENKPSKIPNSTIMDSDLPDQPFKELQVPRGIDHRFFVSGAPQCFRDSLFEDKNIADDEGDDNIDEEE